MHETCLGTAVKRNTTTVRPSGEVRSCAGHLKLIYAACSAPLYYSVDVRGDVSLAAARVRQTCNRHAEAGMSWEIDRCEGERMPTSLMLCSSERC